MQGERQNAEGVRVPYLRCWQWGGERAVVPATCPGDEFPDASRVGLAIGILRREPLVVVIVSIDHDRCLALYMSIQNGFHLRIVPMLLPLS